MAARGLTIILLLSMLAMASSPLAQPVEADAVSDPCNIPATDDETIEITVSPEFYPDVQLPAGMTFQTDFDGALQQAAIFAWQQFIAMTWPAKAQDGSYLSRGEPDTSGNYVYGEAGPTGQVVWDSNRHKVEIFPGMGDPPGLTDKIGFPNGADRDYGYDELPEYRYGARVTLQPDATMSTSPLTAQTIDLSVPEPTDASQLKLLSTQGAKFRADFNTWSLVEVGEGMSFSLDLLQAEAVTLKLRIAATLVKGKSDNPFSILVNGKNFVTNFDDHNDGYHDLWWTIPANQLKQGPNEIDVVLSDTAATQLFVQSITAEEAALPSNNLDEVTQIGLNAMYAGAGFARDHAGRNDQTDQSEKILFEAKANRAMSQDAFGADFHLYHL